MLYEEEYLASQHTHTKEVLIIEDSHPDRLRFRNILDDMKLKYRFAWDAKSNKLLDMKRIMELIEESKFNCIILDLR